MYLPFLAKVASAGLADLSRAPASDLGPGGSFPGETADIRILRKLSRHRARYNLIIN